MQLRYLLVAGSLWLPVISLFALDTDVSAADSLPQPKNLKEVTVTGNSAEQKVLSTKMGHVSLSGESILEMPVLFGEPDIVRALHTMPGVSQGVEGFTGLFVRGGENDQNLFLYQGLPLYQVSHLGGIFSSFNVATVEGVDFYKAAFPSCYGGRVSSITDISMKQPDFERYHGRLSIGLLSANAYVSGPIVKGKTAFSAGVRRSWIDLVSIPAIAILNNLDKSKGQKHQAGYSFMDFNARIDHKFNNRASAHFMGYYGHDNLKLGLREFGTNYLGVGFFDDNSNKLSWGNWGLAGAFDYRLDCGSLNMSLYYSDYSSYYRQEREYQTDMTEEETYGYSRNDTRNAIRDLGVNLNFASAFSSFYQLRAGVGYIHHDYLPEGLVNESRLDSGSFLDDNGNPHLPANEMFAFVDNNFDITGRMALNVGLRGVTYRINHQSYNALEPRASLRVSLTERYSLKFSYARMSQFVQQISSNYINLPTDLWQPGVVINGPVRSNQYSAGFYGALPVHSISFSGELWYKDMTNLLEYRDGVSVLDPGLTWQQKLVSGKGYSYGFDLDASATVGKWSGSVGYGLLWSWRKFDELNQGKKFPAKFDNRHKINIGLCFKLSDKVDFNANWVYMTGNRLTLSLYNYDGSNELFPDAPKPDNPGLVGSLGLDYYSSRNNIRMPAYHRLDLSVNFYREYRNGRRGIWNISIYNAYCHLNTITIQKDSVNDIIHAPSLEVWHRAFKTLSLIPIIPSVSYTYIF